MIDQSTRWIRIFLAVLLFVMGFGSRIPSSQGAVREHVDYLIITVPGISTSVSGLLKHRQKQGLQTAIYETGEIYNKYPGATRQDQIRNFLISKYEAWNLRYVVLIGDDIAIPYETFYPFYPRDSAEYKNAEIVSDFFYCSLDRDLDINQNGYTGEFSGDRDVSFHSEVRVGRIPFNTPYEVSIIVNRMIRNESRSPRKSVLLTSSILNYQNEEASGNEYLETRTEGASLTEAIYQDLLKPLLYKVTRMGEKTGIAASIYPAEYALKKKNFEYLLANNEFDMVVWEGHGTPGSLISKIWTRDKNNNKKVEKKELTEEVVLDMQSIPGTGKDHSLFISGCCSNLFPSAESNLGKEVLLKGFSCFIGGTSINYYSLGWANIKNGGNQTLIYLLTRNIVLRNESYGDALYNAIEECRDFYSVLGSFDYANYYSFNLYGDPASRLVPSFGRDFTATLDKNFKTVQLGENIYFTVHTDSVGFTDMISLKPINYDPTKFVVEVTPERSNVPGSFIIKIKPIEKIYPTIYTLTLQLSSPSKTVFLCPRFTILPYGKSARVYLNFPEWHVKRNTSFTLDVFANGVFNLDSIYTEIKFDPTILAIQSNGINPGSFMAKDGVVPKVQTKINKDGTASITVSRDRKRAGVGGDGNIAHFTFKALKNGFTAITIQKVIAMNPNQEQIALDIEHSRVSVSDLGLYISPEISLSEVVSKRSYFNEGETNGNKIWFIENENEILLDKTGRLNFITHFASSERSNAISWLIQRENSFSQVRSFIRFTNVIEINLWINNYWAFINEDPFLLESPPLLQNNRTMVPLRFLAETLETQTSWDKNSRSITLVRGNQKILLTIGSTKALIENNGITTTILLDAPPIIVNSRTLVPLRFISETFNTNVIWNQTYNLITLSYAKV